MQQKDQKVVRDKRGRIHRGGMPKGHKVANTLSKEMAREALRVIVTQHMQEMTEAQVAAAKGLKYLMARNKRGGEFKPVTREQIEGGILKRGDTIIEVWDKQPSTAAYIGLMDRALDKPKEQEQRIALTVTDLVERLKSARKRANAGGR